MKLLALIFLAVSAFAEPPVNRYLPPSQTYGAPGFGGQRQTDAIIRNRPVSSYSAPSRRPSSEYGSPNQTPSNQYGPPSQSISNQYRTPSQSISNQYIPPSQSISNQYRTPSQSISNQYGPPSQSISNQYGPPSQSISNQYLPPQSARLTQPSTQYGVPNQGFGSSDTGVQYATPSQEYGVPGFGARGGNKFSQNGVGSNGYNRAQSRQYLPPNQNGYGYDDGSNGEPANYNFEYMVKDEPSGNDFGHRESRQGDRAEGLYYVLLPDGRKQTVEYEADENGYRPKISYQDTGLGAGGYNRNAQDDSFSNGGYQY